MSIDVSVVIPVFNGEKTLPLCLDSLMSLEYPKEKVEILVIDNNSTDNTKNIIKQYPVKYLFEHKRSRGAARNKGVKEAKAEFIAFIDSDCVADKGWIKNIMQGFTKDYIAGCGGRLLSYPPRTYIERFKQIKTSLLKEDVLFSKDFILPTIPTANAIYRRNVLIEIGMFDDSCGIRNEDIDLSLRICLNGYQLCYIPEAVVYYKYRDNIRGLFEQNFEAGYSRIYLYKKYRKYKKISKELLYPYFTRYSRYLLLFCQNSSLFFSGLFSNKERFDRMYPFLKIIDGLLIFLGEMYALLVLIEKEKIKPVKLPERKVYWRKLRDDVIITKLEGQYYYVLNDTGAQIWELLMEDKRDSQIIDNMLQMYKINKEQAGQDLDAFIDELEKEELLSDGFTQNRNR